MFKWHQFYEHLVWLLPVLCCDIPQSKGSGKSDCHSDFPRLDEHGADAEVHSDGTWRPKKSGRNLQEEPFLPSNLWHVSSCRPPQKPE